MVAGASGIDLVILVVAADDGVMPQTREHLAIMTLLGLSRGLVALTKIDMVEPGMVELASEDVRGAVEGTFLEDAPILPALLDQRAGPRGVQARAVQLASRPGRARPKASSACRSSASSARTALGTIVTGIPMSGTSASGDVLEILPGPEGQGARDPGLPGGQRSRARRPLERDQPRRRRPPRS
jgi:selenocysteine-specific elongation factor